MLKRFTDFLAGAPMTIVAGVFLLLDLVPHLTEEFTGTAALELPLPFDPAWVTIFISGIPLVYLGLWRIRHNKGISKISSALLIDVAMVAAIAIDELFAAGEVAFIMALGAILEDATTERAKKGLKNLIALAPTMACRVTDGVEEEIPAEQVRVGDVLRVRPGETIPVDGRILEGETSVDQSVMTGESLPQDKGPGDDVFSGTINRFGSIDLTATKVGEDSSLSRLIRMVEDAENKQAPMQRIADRVASWLVPVALGIAVVSYLVTGDLVKAVTVLVVFCPCALVLATPTAIMAAIGQATRHGVIIKSGEALERMGKVDTVAFDKTGTLTYGRLEVSDVLPLGGAASGEKDGAGEKDALLALVASAESLSEHPLGRAVVERARERGLALAEPAGFSMDAGRGVRAEVGGAEVVCGSVTYLSGRGVDCAAAEGVLASLRAEGKATVLVASGGALVGVIALSDVLRPDSASMCERLSGMGVRTVLLTGDSEAAATYFAGKAGVSEVRAELLPEEKVASVEALQAEGRVVCMVGDGVNDAPALATADVSVAMGEMGSDIAVDAADVALMSDDISKIPYLKRLACACVATIKFGITLSMCLNAIAIVLSLLGVLTPVTGALWHNAGSVIVVLIAALLYDRKFE
ncbi:heavy metal translocating P-type ATPase [Olsenella profusa]|uniref:Cation-translocating P-type ATPase n=1 Tax=Olsenella profusa TaxID=138595 RepID=A0ABS2EZN4_9ACTN|nr:cation-translocating P-type ATPase [Olsenella profusa]MBM6774191.1 cation-translocating P-type ATPase [Olsenella profusa]